MPKGWPELSDDELAVVYRTMATYQGDIRFHVLRRLAGISFVHNRKDRDRRLCVINTVDSEGKPGKTVLFVPVETFAGALETLDWLHEPGNVPVRLNRLRGHEALDRRFRGVSFDTYLKTEALYQGFLESKDRRAIAGLLTLLYPGWEDADEMPTGEETLNVVQWIVQLKNMFTGMFTNLFKSVSPEGDAPRMVDVINNQIRILTGGDVTKEEQIRNIDCWRALTELDYKALEADEMRKEYDRIKR